MSEQPKKGYVLTTHQEPDNSHLVHLKQNEPDYSKILIVLIFNSVYQGFTERKNK